MFITWLPLIIFAILLLVWIIVSWKINHVDSPAYIVVSKNKDYEIRTYKSYVIAETIVEGMRKQAVREGFFLLLSYISGANQGKSKIAMTAPVGVSESASVKIAMTAPVMVRNNSATSHVISFMMPKGQTLETLPQPTDPRVVLKLVPSHTVAVHSFSWYASESRIASKKEALKSALIRDDQIMLGSLSYAGYSAPITIPFMEKHEVVVEIQR